MCGICCVFSSVDGSDQHTHEQSRLAHRGPDRSHQCSLNLACGLKATFIGHVLHLRGNCLATQPAEDAYGNLLLWNGEIFDGIEVPDGESDTDVLLAKLGCCKNEDEILATMAQVHGPWSFIYWQKDNQSLWFGRDMFGRRSLLWHLPSDWKDEFYLSSVKLDNKVHTEVPAIGIFKLTPPASQTGCYSITVFPWRLAVWPGTLEPVQQDFSNRLSAGQSLSEGYVQVTLSSNEVPSHRPTINRTFPPDGLSRPPALPGQSHLEYLQNVLQTSEQYRKLSDQLLSVLLMAVKTRVHNHVPLKRQTVINDSSVDSTVEQNSNGCNSLDMPDTCMKSEARIAILFSGGIDSTVIAALADRCVPIREPIDLLNVAFEQIPKEQDKRRKRCEHASESNRWSVPDRLTGYTALSELNPDRPWNFIEVNVTGEELKITREAHIKELVYPLVTVLDDSIGCAVWFATRGCGTLGNGPHQGARIVSTARVVLCGMGADEQLAGYSRHRNVYQAGGLEALNEELELELSRISARNLGRDDRVITDHGKESRFPFLDEKVVQYLAGLPTHQKACLDLSRGLGEKFLLRLCAVQLQLMSTSTLAKRAIQFGSRIAKLENSKEKATDVCDRL
ncbi:asparagine synthetase domain-containing protein 1-like isoform X2 [Dreissena polymorpha]|uniref:asparagine synthetase domain-containing protein 1-like isoform X2 n=1 Tax=Dreissena polymorpha TaxID=45954 RepID=UPI002264C0F2|nr:asparagine synthetase domain-containing protein 1-like isoform X2 [Dreissena polymorpha]